MGWPSREALHRDQGLWTHAEAFLWGLERGVGSFNPGTVVDGGGLICSPDSFILKESRISALELLCFRAFKGMCPSCVALIRLAVHLVPLVLSR